MTNARTIRLDQLPSEILADIANRLENKATNLAICSKSLRKAVGVASCARLDSVVAGSGAWNSAHDVYNGAERLKEFRKAYGQTLPKPAFHKVCAQIYGKPAIFATLEGSPLAAVSAAAKYFAAFNQRNVVEAFQHAPDGVVALRGLYEAAEKAATGDKAVLAAVHYGYAFCMAFQDPANDGGQPNPLAPVKKNRPPDPPLGPRAPVRRLFG